MIFAASKDLNLDLGRSVLIGDRLSDLQAGASAGVAYVAHVLNGHGAAERPTVQLWSELRVASQTKVLLLPGLEQFPLRLLTAQDGQFA